VYGIGKLEGRPVPDECRRHSYCASSPRYHFGVDQGAEHVGHLGLSTMAERAEAIGADFTITSELGAGSKVTVSLAHHRPVDEGTGSDAD
jgi:hypothetical protein